MFQPTLTPAAFAAKWRDVTTTEKAASQEHFIDLCRMLGEPTPHEVDPIGSQYAFEKRVVKAGGGDSPTSLVDGEDHLHHHAALVDARSGTPALGCFVVEHHAGFGCEARTALSGSSAYGQDRGSTHDGFAC